MDHSWINARRTSDEYENGVEEFLEFAKRNLPDSNGKFYFPCVNCLNEKRLQVKEIREHVLCDGFCKTYTIWIWHGESLDLPSVSQTEEVDVDMDDRLEDKIRDIGLDPAFQEKRKKAQQLQAKNVYPHRLSCGGYELLEERMMQEKLKERQQACESNPYEVVSPPSPPSRHEK